MTTIAIGKKIPTFILPATGEKQIATKDLKGKNVILYFYPKDSTPGCTREGIDFSEAYHKFTKQNAMILGVSRDSLTAHEKFKCHYEFPFDLLSDQDESVCELFGVMKTKNKFGKMSRGIERSTFLIDEDQILRQVWRNVRVDGHVDEVLAALKTLTM